MISFGDLNLHMDSNNFETNAIRTQTERSQFLEHSTPLYLTSSFVFEDAEDMRASFSEEKQRNIYSRFTNPNNSEFVENVSRNNVLLTMENIRKQSPVLDEMIKNHEIGLAGAMYDVESGAVEFYD